ncbi:MAG: bifunctional DNA-binding transcriptional regulator/O6-methylguanine-DNA methyltransferase Ada [Armatimonadota bacterium]|nr:bifunctional DNA-binding transcriptional regulator/O6-methylguanine-DNA methyltransferase Ada [Armatimonadota bacterium]MDR7486126.1 bifunctional DNA-binding transcriptional regulator/O6-methylguanine-DNA methyltransferase Ada [Armatimonadota bacterium]MDR7531757.1 bifunctional DNA-binding transcriptional regulator/O6-methylguanine-DNA methyltransferase Ada [Armatimonadota bacterium]MDR7534898.1 bifunctional DNA-binding transcriptional regulator/O6-methylguanine-DNA methyltransferase Ada [Arm
MTDDERWRHVQARNGAADGRFVFAVRTTGVYCRPSCPARRPRRAHVQFFATPAAAAQAGFQPCRRCRPHEAVAAAVPPWVQQVCRRLVEAPDDVALAVLAAEVGLGPRRLARVFRCVVGLTPRQFADAVRIGRLRQSLRDGQRVTSALYDAGFGASSRLYERAAALLGMSPGAYRRGAPGMRIRCTTVASPLGRLLIAATDRGLCAVRVGDDDAALMRGVAREFPQAQIVRDDAGLRRWAGALLQYLRGWQPHVDLPLDIRGTAFQWRVWRALQRIGYGQTRTYGQIARALGDPQAARAVARACAANPVALVIPCHRVVRGDGGLGGYRWGVRRKRWLLAREAAGGGRGRRRARRTFPRGRGSEHDGSSSCVEESSWRPGPPPP